MTFFWLLLLAAALFGLLALDAARLSTPSKDVPYSLTAMAWGEDVAHVPLAEQERRRQFNAQRGLGDLSQSVWLFGILSAGCLVDAAYLFLA